MRPLSSTARRGRARESSLSEWREALRDAKAEEAARRLKNLSVINKYNEDEEEREMLQGKTYNGITVPDFDLGALQLHMRLGFSGPCLESLTGKRPSFSRERPR